MCYIFTLPLFSPLLSPFSSFLPKIYFAFFPLIFCPKFWILYLENYICFPMENKEAAWKKWLFFWRPDPSFSFFLLPSSITASIDSADFLYYMKLNHNRQLGCTLNTPQSELQCLSSYSYFKGCSHFSLAFILWYWLPGDMGPEKLHLRNVWRDSCISLSPSGLITCKQVVKLKE